MNGADEAMPIPIVQSLVRAMMRRDCPAFGMDDVRTGIVPVSM